MWAQLDQSGTPAPVRQQRAVTVGICALAVLLAGGCERSLGPPDSFVSARVDSVWASLADSAAEGWVSVYVDGRFNPNECARVTDWGVVFAGDTLVYVRPSASRTRDCADVSGRFRHIIRVDNQPARTITISAGGLMQESAATLLLRLPLER